jgi:hypothetical protein
MNIQHELVKIIDALNDAEIPYALCGGWAVVFHGYTRLTKDIDILIREENLTEVQSIVRTMGYVLPSGLITFKAGTAEETKLFRLSHAEGADFVTLDLLLVTPVFEEVWASRKEASDGQRDFWIVSRAGLRVMKCLSGREQDIADLAMLKLIEENT